MTSKVLGVQTPSCVVEKEKQTLKTIFQPPVYVMKPLFWRDLQHFLKSITKTTSILAGPIKPQCNNITMKKKIIIIIFHSETIQGPELDFLQKIKQVFNLLTNYSASRMKATLCCNKNHENIDIKYKLILTCYDIKVTTIYLFLNVQWQNYLVFLQMCLQQLKGPE